MAPPLVMGVFGLLLVVAALVRTAPVHENGGIGDQSSCTERRVQYWSERSRDAVQRIKDTRYDLDTKIEVLGNLATTKDLEDYEEMLVESSLDSLNEIFQYGALIFGCPLEEEDHYTVPKKGVIVDRIRQEMLVIMEHLRDILREGIPEQQQDQPRQGQPQQGQPQQDQPQQDQPQQVQPQQVQPQQVQPQQDQPQQDQPQQDQPQQDQPMKGQPQQGQPQQGQPQQGQPQQGQPQQGQPQQGQPQQGQTLQDPPQQDQPQAEQPEKNNQDDDEATRGQTQFGVCIARVRQQHQGQDETSIFQAILSQCQSKREITKEPPSEDDETKRGNKEMGLCIARVRQRNQGQNEASIFQAILSQCQSKREITKDPPSEDDETKRGNKEMGLCIARVRQQNQGQDEASIFQAILSQCQSKREITKDPPSEDDETKRGNKEMGLCIARVRQQHQGQDEASIFQAILSQCQSKREITQYPSSEDDETKRGDKEMGVCIARVRQQHQGQDEASIFQAILRQCQSKREITKDPPSEDDETKRGQTQFGVCIARVRQQHQGQDEASIFQAILSQCQSKREMSLPLSETQKNQEDEDIKRGASEMGLCIARVRQKHQGQDEASIFQAILSQCQSKREITKDPPSEDDETKRGNKEMGLCIARVRQQNQGQDEASIFQAILSQCQSKREITKDPPSEDDETKRGNKEMGLCIARVRQQHQGQDEASIFQAILSQCQSKREITKDPPSEDDETKRGNKEMGLCIARVRQQHQGQDEASIFQAILSQCQSKREITQYPSSEDDETKRGDKEMGVCIARVRQQHQGQDEASIFQAILRQCQSKREITKDPPSEDDETKRGQTQFGVCIARVRQQHQGQDEASIFQAILRQCQSKQEISKDPPSEYDDETKRGDKEMGVCIARVRQQHQGQDEASIFQAILSQCQSKREMSLPLSETQKNQEDEDVKRGASEMGLCIARVRQKHQGQDEASIFQAILSQCQSKREITKDPPSEDDETKRGQTQFGVCIARVRQQHQGQDEASIFQAIQNQCQGKREVLFEPFM
ncbi:uncharacterized protein [Asterias amurensis]